DAEIWMVDLDGTGAMHPASKGDPGAVSYTRTDTLPTWQPIESAPKDGTWFLGFEPRKYIEDQIRVWRWVETNSFTGFEDAADTSDFYDQPTHWRPRPLAPKGHAHD
ncbi:hypothetical protein VWX99_20035, partial [Phaeobacter sp. JH18-27]